VAANKKAPTAALTPSAAGKLFDPDRTGTDRVEINLDWEIPSPADDPLIFLLAIRRGDRTSSVRLQVDLGRLDTPALERLHGFLAARHANLTPAVEVAKTAAWLLDLSLQQFSNLSLIGTRSRSAANAAHFYVKHTKERPQG
jgi:hypothetical protein